MQSRDTLLAMFSAEIRERDGSTVFEVPAREIELGDLSVGDRYRITVLDQLDTDHGSSQRSRQDSGGPPVGEGDEIEVEIEDIGEQGDGIARAGEGYILFVPDTEIGDRVTIEVGKTLENFGFGEVVSPEPIAE